MSRRGRRACRDAASQVFLRHLHEALPQLDQDIRSLEERGLAEQASLVRELRDATAELLRGVDRPRGGRSR